jgi:Flp pilus assembly protein TadD
VVGILAYSNTYNVPFVLDDTSQIKDNRMIRDFNNFALFLQGKEFKPQHNYHFRPSRAVGYFSLALNYRFGGDDVRGYHAVNIMTHLLCALLVYFLVLITFRTPNVVGWPAARHHASAAGQRFASVKLGDAGDLLPAAHSSHFIALFAALLFAAHPIQTQAVTYTIQRFASLATLFYLFSVVMYINGRLVWEEAKQGAAPASPVRTGGVFRMLACFSLSTLSAAIAMLTKEIAFTLPAVIVAHELIFFGFSCRKKILFLVPILLTLLIIPLTIIGSDRTVGELLSELGMKTRVDTVISRYDYLLTQMRVVVTYLRLVFVPINQNVDYDYPVYHSFTALPVIASFLFLLAVLGITVYMLFKSRQEAKGAGQQKKNNEQDVVSPAGHTLEAEDHYRLVAFGIFWFFITLSVESSIIPIRDVIFEHRVYLPSAGLFIATAAGISAIIGKFGDRLPSLKKNLILGTLIVIAALALATYARNGVWKDEVTLWRDVVAKSPGKTRPLYNLGEAYFARGQFNEGIQAYQDAVRVKPDDTEAHYNLGVAYTKVGRINDAMNEYLIAISLDPNNALAHNNLGSAFLEKGRHSEAVREFRAAIRIMPDYAGAHLNLGSALMLIGQNNEALEHLMTAAALDPYTADPYVNMGIIYDQQGRLPEAAQSFQSALRISPSEPGIHYALARAYVNLNLLEDAVGEFQVAVRIRPDYADAHHDLGAIYFKLGRIQEAISEFQKVLEIKPDDIDARNNLRAIHKSLEGSPPVSQGAPAYKPPF